MPRNRSEKEPQPNKVWVKPDQIPLNMWTQVTVTYDTDMPRDVQFNIPTERGLEIHKLDDEGNLKLLRIIKGGTW